MHKAKQHLAHAAERLGTMERKKFLLASTIIVAFTLIVVGGTVALINILQTPQPSVDGTRVIISGEVACLPHKNASGPHTLECALGLRSDDNRYYALKDAPSSIGNGVSRRIQVHGKLSTTVSSMYDIVGTIAVTSVTPQP